MQKSLLVKIKNQNKPDFQKIHKNNFVVENR